MVRQLLNWRIGLALLAVAIVTGTIFYSNFLAKKIAVEERKKVNVWVQSLKTRATVTEPSALDLTNIITSENTDIPIIETNEKDSITGYVNIDSLKAATDKDYLPARLKKLRSINEPIIWTDPGDSTKINKYYNDLITN